MTKLKIGRISYTNTWPITHFFDEGKFSGQIELIPQVPSTLNKRMAEGNIDLGPISSFSYGEHADEYILLPNLSVSAYGNVGSISLFLKGNLEDIVNNKVALSSTSATSVNLLKIILEGFLGGEPEYITMPPELDKMMEVADAALLIGDEALLAGLKNKITQQYTMLDLGEEWLKRTNHWMTFAVWAVRREVVNNQPEILFQVYQEFINSKLKGKLRIDEIIKQSLERFGGTKDFWAGYFNGLTHDFGTEQINGLNLYFENAYKIGVLKKVPKIEVIDFEALTIASK